jgi:hypothetical protein
MVFIPTLLILDLADRSSSAQVLELRVALISTKLSLKIFLSLEKY